ncbi:MAG TPA: hypothetical protein EYO31_08935 [Phycisphaerales bacterium]|nr:hypothetical protein [Phycisphaerales bacterium]
MIRFLKWTRVMFWWGLGILMASTVMTVVAYERYHFPTQFEIQHSTNISTEYSGDYQETILKSRTSSVMLMSTDIFMGGIATSSGTYFVANDTPYVVTTAHGVVGPCFLVAISHENTTVSCDEFIVVDTESDYIIMKLEEEIPGRTPIEIPKDLPLGNEWRKSYSILNKIIYTGYPNLTGPLTLKGDVVGYAGEELIYIFSHAYSGSSGSGVFSTNGKYIGMIMAIDVGENELGVTVLENIVIVTPAYKIDWSVVLN